jgi:hypothetical protein
VSFDESRSICGHIFFYGGCPVLWKTHKEANVICSPCEAEIKNMADLHLCPIGPIPVYNDNQGTVDWSHTFSTKGVRHLNIRQNAVCEAEWLQKISV